MQTITLEENLTIYNASAQKQQLLALVNSPALTLDLSRVEEIDMAGVQLLLLLQCDMAEHDWDLSLVNLSPAVRELFDLLNLHQHFRSHSAAIN